MNDNKETPDDAAPFIFVDPKNDVALRKIFGDENKKEILISFLNNILEFALRMISRELQEPKELREAFNVANQMSWSKEELEAYDARGIYIQDELGRIEYALEEGRRSREVEIARELKKNGVNIKH